MKQWYVYILKSINHNKHYVGLTDNVDRRFFEHNKGWVNKTRRYRPYQLIHVELTNNRKQARELEEFFKSGYGREIIKEIEAGLAV